MRIRLSRSRERARRDFDEGLSDEEFLSAYRMPRAAFERLVNLLRPHIAKKIHSKILSGREEAGFGVLGVRERVAMSLRILAGASYHDVAMVFHVSRSTIYENFYRLIESISSGSVKELRINFPFDDDEKLKEIADEFSQTSSNHPALYGCVGALDGYAIRIQRPSIRDVENPLDYANRKGYFSLNMQAICDSRCRFTYIYIGTPGSTHDATAYVLSSFSEKWEALAGKKLWYIAADEAYPATENLITPWPGRKLGLFKDSFNFHLSGGNRNVIERAFGLLTKRWGILWRKLDFRLHRVPQIVLACASIHNFLIDFWSCRQPSKPISLEKLGSSADFSAEHRCGLIFSPQQGREVGSRRDREKSIRRLEMTNALRAAGKLRPAVFPLRIQRRFSH